MAKTYEHKELAELIGQLVWYYPAPLRSGQTTTDPGPDPEGQPLPALITHICHLPETKEDRAKGDLTPLDLTTRVNLAVFMAHGGHYGVQDIPILDDGEIAPEKRFAEWPEHSEKRVKALEVAKKKAEDEAAKKANTLLSTTGQDRVEVDHLSAAEKKAHQDNARADARATHR